DRVQVQLLTLETLVDMGLWETVVKTFGVEISRDDSIELAGRLRATRELETVREWNDDLWKIVRGDSRYVFRAHRFPENIDPIAETHSVPSTYFSAPLLARETGLPLM